MSSTKIKFLYVDRETTCKKINFRMRALKPSTCEKEKSQKKFQKSKTYFETLTLESSYCRRPCPLVAAVVVLILILPTVTATVVAILLVLPSLSPPLSLSSFSSYHHRWRIRTGTPGGGGGGAVAGSAPTIVAASRILLALARLCRLAHRHSYPRSSPPPPLKPESSAKAQARHCREGVWMGERVGRGVRELEREGEEW